MFKLQLALSFFTMLTFFQQVLNDTAEDVQIHIAAVPSERGSHRFRSWRAAAREDGSDLNQPA
jgi:hypothetical protein